MKKQRLPILDSQLNAKELLVSLIIGNPSLGIAKTLQIFGLKQALDVANIRELRIMFSKYSPRSFYRLVSEAKQIKLTELQDPFVIIDKQLNDFIPLKLVDFQDKMINNDKYN